MNRAIMISVLAIVGVLATYVSGLSPLYGFPLPWITTVGGLCFGGFACPRPPPMNYDWIVFVGDVLFNTAILCGLVFTVLSVRKDWNERIERAKKQGEELQKAEPVN